MDRVVELATTHIKLSKIERTILYEIESLESSINTSIDAVPLNVKVEDCDDMVKQDIDMKETIDYVLDVYLTLTKYKTLLEYVVNRKNDIGKEWAKAKEQAV